MGYGRTSACLCSWRSAPTRGTRFRVTLPIAVEPATSLPSSAILGPGGRRRILVVDDDPKIRSVSRRVLGRQHDVVLADSGGAALDAIARQSFDVVLFDLMMPEVSGVELHDRIRESPPELLGRLGVLTGGAFTREAGAFMARSSRASSKSRGSCAPGQAGLRERSTARHRRDELSELG